VAVNLRKKLIAALLTVHGLSLVALGMWLPATQPFGGIGDLPLLMSQAALLAMWAALGNASDRNMIATLLLAAMGLLFGIGHAAASRILIRPAQPLWEFFAFFVLFLLAPLPFALFGTLCVQALSLPWRMLRSLGIEVCDANDATQYASEAPFQFTLGQAFAWTAIIAMLFAIGRLENISGLLTFGAVILLQVSIMFLAGWATLSPRDVRPRLFVVLVAALILGLLPAYYSRGDMRDFGFYIAIAVSYAAILSGSLLVFRSCGYRLVRIGDRR
jgi:hypothetical protein